MNNRHIEEASASSCCVTGAVTEGHRWVLSRIVTGSVTNIWSRTEVSCITQLRKSEPLFFKAFYSLHYVAYIFPVMSMLNNENSLGQ